MVHLKMAGYSKGNDDPMGDTLRLFLTEKKTKNPWFSRLPAVFFMWNFSCLFRKEWRFHSRCFQRSSLRRGHYVAGGVGVWVQMWFQRASGGLKGCHLNWGVNRIRFPPVASVEAGLRVIFVLSRWWQLKWFCLFHLDLWGNDPIWLVFFKWVCLTTNQYSMLHLFVCSVSLFQMFDLPCL